MLSLSSGTSTKVKEYFNTAGKGIIALNNIHFVGSVSCLLVVVIVVVDGGVLIAEEMILQYSTHLCL